jgi:hypothetical protein
MNSPHPEPVVSKDSEYTAPGVAVWAPRLRLTNVIQDESGKHVEFSATDNGKHIWAPDLDKPELDFVAEVHPTVQLEEGKEYFAYFVPVEEMVHDK